MRVAVLSDTHLVSPDHWFEEVFQRHLAPADVVLHCGDVTGHDVLYYLMGHPAFYAVAGNMDGWVLSDDLPPTRRLEFEGVRIGMAHGWGFHGRILEPVWSGPSPLRLTWSASATPTYISGVNATACACSTPAP